MKLREVLHDALCRHESCTAGLGYDMHVAEPILCTPLFAICSPHITRQNQTILQVSAMKGINANMLWIGECDEGNQRKYAVDRVAG